VRLCPTAVCWPTAGIRAWVRRPEWRAPRWRVCTGSPWTGRLSPRG